MIEFSELIFFRLDYVFQKHSFTKSSVNITQHLPLTNPPPLTATNDQLAKIITCYLTKASLCVCRGAIRVPWSKNHICRHTSPW